MEKTIDEFFEEMQEKIEAMSGRPGVQRLRDIYAKCRDRDSNYHRRMGLYRYEQRPYVVDEKWAHRHGIKTSRWMEIEADAYRIALTSCPLYRRGSYDEILKPTNMFDDMYTHAGPGAMKIWTRYYQRALDCVRDIEKQGFDEHGGWQQGHQFDKHKRGYAVNVDIYGIDPVNNLYVIQVRMFERRYKNGYGNVRKSYFLIGYNDNGNPFAHPISAHMVRAAIRRNPSIDYVVKSAQAWIWGIDVDRLDDVLRNGDVAMIPAGRNFRRHVEPVDRGMLRVVDSHWLYTRRIVSNGALYAYDPTLRHFNGQHPTVRGRGWYKIIVGNRADYHDFARPTAD